MIQKKINKAFKNKNLNKTLTGLLLKCIAIYKIV